jgi:phosphogluconate dehydratase
MVHPVVAEVTRNIIQRSELGTNGREKRSDFVARMEAAASGPGTTVRAKCGSCSGLAHVYATATNDEKEILIKAEKPSIGILSAATDMLSAHQPFYHFHDVIKAEALRNTAVAQIIGQTPAICDGTVQGRTGMNLSLLSRNAIAQTIALGACHNTSDGIIALATCDKIKPGFIMGLGSFAHLPAIFAPGGPMSTGQSNGEKNEIRQLRAREKKGEIPITVGEEGELRSEMKSYHSPGTCTFYGTANGNEMIAEMMGLHLPGSSFISPNLSNGTPDPFRDAMTQEATRLMIQGKVPELYTLLNAETFVNGTIALLATGGSTNLGLHLPAMAQAHGIHLTLEDISELSRVVPSIAKIYPNGPADINGFQDAGGTAMLFKTLLNADILHRDVKTVAGTDLSFFTQEPTLVNGKIEWAEGLDQTRDKSIIAPEGQPFSTTGGLTVLKGRLGTGLSKISALTKETMYIRAPAKIFDSQDELHEAYMQDKLKGDFVAVVRGQGPHQNGMPELHKLITPLTNCQKKGQKVGMITNGRLSGASGGILSAIHMSSTSNDNEAINKVREGDMMIIDANNNIVDVELSDEEWAARTPEELDMSGNKTGLGSEMFKTERETIGPASQGAMPPWLLQYGPK